MIFLIKKIQHPLLVLLLAVPLSAQQDISIVPAQAGDITINIDSIAVTVIVELPPPDSAAVARDEATQRAMASIADYLENCGCVNTGPTTVNVLANAGLTLAAFFIGWQLKRIADKPDGDDIHDTTIKVTVPPNVHDDDDHGEGNKP